MKSVYHKIIIFGFLFFLVFLFFLRLFYPTQQIFMIPDFGESDVLNLNLPLKEILSTSLKNREWPLWTPYLANGFPIQAEGQIGTFYLPNLLLFRFLPTVTAYNLNLAVAFLLSGIGSILFFRLLGFSSLTSLYAAIIFTFSGFLSVHLNHFNLIQAASLLPLIFWSSYRLFKRPHFSNMLLFAFILSQQVFTGHFYIVFITLVGIFIFWTAFLFSLKKIVYYKKIIYLFFSLLITFGLCAIQLFPTIELWQKSERQSGLSFEAVTSYPYPPKHLLTFIAPYAFGSPADGTYPPIGIDWGIFWENTAYIGVVPLLFALASFIRLRDKLVKTGFLLFAISILLVLSKYSPIYFILSLPPFNFFRVPSKFLLLSAFSLTMLSAYTVEKIMRNRRRGAGLIFFFLILLSVLFDEYQFSYHYPPVSPVKWWTTVPETAKLLNAGDKVVTIGAPLFWNSVFLKKGWQNMAPYVYFRNSLYPNYNVLFSLSAANINTGGLVPKRTALLSAFNKEISIDEKEQTASISASTANVLSLQNVNYLISPYKITNPHFTQIASINPPDPNLKLNPFLVYKNPKSLPRAYIAYNSKIINTVEDFYREISDDKFLENKNILVEDNRFLISNPNNPAGKTQIINTAAQNISLETDSSSAGILVLSDTNYPGWHAYLDGKEAEIFFVNLTQRGILLPEGDHKINFIYNPISFTLGKSITTLSGIIMFLAVFLYRGFYPHKASGNKRLSLRLYNKGSN